MRALCSLWTLLAQLASGKLQTRRETVDRDELLVPLREPYPTYGMPPSLERPGALVAPSRWHWLPARQDFCSKIVVLTI